jgi:aminopeptidase N
MPIAEITRAECAERAGMLYVHNYDIQLDLTRGDKTFRSTSVIDFECGQPGAATYVDLIAADVVEVSLNGAPLDPATAYTDGRIVLTGLAPRNELQVVADCQYSHSGSGLHRAVDTADGRVYLYTQFEPADARRMFANFEQPDLKAEFTFHVIAPADWIVLSNQPAPDPEPAGSGIAVWHFPPTPRISTYLTAVVAGEYRMFTGSHTTPSGQVIPLGVACRQSLAEFAEPDDMMAITRQGLDFFTRVFASDYPFEKYDQVFVPEFSAGAMENAGCVVFSERLLFRSRVTDAMYELRAAVILHEMAHQWFGDLVTMRWWSDLWLNESFADFCAALASAEGTRFTDAWTTFSAARKAWGYQQDQLPSTHPVSADVPTLSEAIANFDGISYAKGAAVLRQLVAYVGRDRFFAGVQAYFDEYGWGNATLADLLGTLEATSGLDLTDWAKDWLQTAGPNTLRGDFTVDDDGVFTSFAVIQEASAEHPVLRPHRIAIGLYSRVDGDLVRTDQVELEVTGPRTEVPDLVGLRQPDLILLNDEDLGYALVRFDPRSLTTLTESIGQFTDSLARTISWSAVVDMVLHAELSVPTFIDMLVGGMASEPTVSSLQNLHGTAARLLATTADPAWVPEGKAKLAGAALPLLRAAEPGSDLQLAWLQLLAWSAVTPEQLDLLAGLLAGTVEMPGLVVDTDLRWSLLRRLATTGRVFDAEIDAEQARDNTDAGRRQAQGCRAAIGDAEHKDAAWRLLTESEELGPDGVMVVAPCFGQPEQADLLTPYAGAYFRVLPDLWANRGDFIRFRLAEALFPIYAASPELIADVDAFLREAEPDAALARILVEQRDEVERALRSRALRA